MRLLLDEMLGPRVAPQLKDRGHDVAAVAERTDLRALPDDAVLTVAQDEQRLLVTRNVADFARLHQQWLADERAHPGIVMLTTRAFRQDRGFVGALVTALVAADTAGTLPGPDQVLFITATGD
ncbi:MAG: DUF5615 family PIN-like protein [Motilibacteraceae bacterium]